jgi:hypothetical protein
LRIAGPEGGSTDAATEEDDDESFVLPFAVPVFLGLGPAAVLLLDLAERGR